MNPKALKSKLKGDFLFVWRHFQPLRQFGTEGPAKTCSVIELTAAGLVLHKPVNTVLIPVRGLQARSLPARQEGQSQNPRMTTRKY